MQEKIFDMLFEGDDVTWQSIIHESVRSEQMDPWDIDLKTLSTRFLVMVRKLKEMDFRISGKIILAAAILLRIKSNRLVGEDLGELDRLLAMTEDDQEEFYDELECGELERKKYDPNDERFKLIPRTPLPRKRKVSVYDLVDALNKALEVKKRRKDFREEIHVEVPKKTVDITEVIHGIYENVRNYFLEKKARKMTFRQLVKDEGDKEEKIYTFIPLLHLSNQGRVNLKQYEHLGEIEIWMKKAMLENEDVEVSEEDWS